MGERQSLLKEAKRRIFSLAPRDLAAALAIENMAWGLGKMLHVLEEEAFCIFTPDCTITRNTGRWQSGFGYGCLIRWRDDLIFPEMRPNGCGMVLARLDEMPDEKGLFERVSALSSSELVIDGTPIRPDFGKGNHFFEFYTSTEVSPEVEGRMPQDGVYAILHCSAPERKHLIYDAFPDEGWVKTPLGMVHVLEGGSAREYLRLWRDFEGFCKKRRELLMREVADGRCAILSNETHQGLFGAKEMRLGCYRASGGSLLPVALRWDLPVYVMRGRENLSPEILEKLGFQRRAEKLGLAEELEHINILPHGGGYRLPIPYTQLKVHGSDGMRYFSLQEPGDGEGGISRYGRIIFTSARELPYDYRGKKVIRKTIEYKLGEPAAKLQPRITLKV